MTDVFSAEKRAAIMRSIKGKDTSPEMTVRRMVHALGCRYRLHVASLPGCPDLVFPSRRRVIFVHGCFWHRHRCRKGKSLPASQTEFWRRKLERNARRDRSVRRRLRRLGWSVLVIWECQLCRPDRVRRKLEQFLRDA
ncbi:MAG: DNA mismatch endonuclease Vsr [Thermogutta sp.]|nr:DNA mismatch endonuclease Vsr [Thermogutta sp.]